MKITIFSIYNIAEHLQNPYTANAITRDLFQGKLPSIKLDLLLL